MTTKHTVQLGELAAIINPAAFAYPKDPKDKFGPSHLDQANRDQAQAKSKAHQIANMLQVTVVS